MSEAAISDKQLAISEIEDLLCRSSQVWPRFSLIAYCLSLIAASPAAISFTVTTAVTSVTHRRLAEGVLIRVGEVYSEQGLKALRTAKHEGLALPYRSFREGTCIQ
jgi:hypothetical protein